jgi:membrane fusion protein, multidrug efflux system
LFVGLSVVPYVYYKEPPSGPNAGKRLQPFYPLPAGPKVAADGETPQTAPPLSGHASGP